MHKTDRIEGKAVPDQQTNFLFYSSWTMPIETLPARWALKLNITSDRFFKTKTFSKKENNKIKRKIVISYKYRQCIQLQHNMPNQTKVVQWQKRTNLVNQPIINYSTADLFEELIQCFYFTNTDCIHIQNKQSSLVQILHTHFQTNSVKDDRISKQRDNHMFYAVSFLF